MDDRLPVMKKPSQPRGRSNRKLLTVLVIFFIGLLLVLFFQSSLSKISQVEVTGQELVDPAEIEQKSELKPGDHFFSVSSSDIEKKVKALPMVESVEVSKHFPGRITIKVQEYPKVAYQIGEEGQVEVLLADASILPVTMKGVPLDKPILTGWSPDDPLKTKLCLTMAKLPPAYFADISEIKPAPSSAYPDKIRLYTRTQFEVQTTIGKLPEKIKYLQSYIANLQGDQVKGGVIKMLEADYYTKVDDTPEVKSPSGEPSSAPSKEPAESKQPTESKQQTETKDSTEAPGAQGKENAGSEGKEAAGTQGARSSQGADSKGREASRGD
ncbi:MULTISPECIES: cell division protein FtsQ/DivIB [Paenibacillus]|uniref:cell division protein FtsQ/DivIB n=1 Tax=Paenibacillus TaxID=44249 RepID=UPI0022B93EBE|nr:FtsQ-type POTRA domain-containing protein [Paenibacillus caseinilyticus]MCZ8518779.1 FtsQ-type POTRA domain-containing protein [Paenibacillus caseinilyticus]